LRSLRQSPKARTLSGTGWLAAVSFVAIGTIIVVVPAELST
jgi:hypothetical protein